MDFLVSMLNLSAFLLGTAALCYSAYRYASPPVRIAMGTFWVTYLLTTFLGGLAIGIQGGDLLDQLSYGLDVGFLRKIGSFQYWMMLFAPFFISGLCLLLVPEKSNSSVAGLSRANRQQEAFRKPARQELRKATVSEIVPLPQFWLVFGSMVGYCLYVLQISGYLNALSMWNTLKGDFNGLMVLRHDIMMTTGNAFFGVVYTSVPTLSHLATYQAVKLKSPAWMFTMGVSILMTVLLSLWTIQKSLLIVYMVSLGLSFALLNVIRMRSLLMYSVLGLGALNIMQSFFVEEWSFLSSIELIVFRVSTAFPYYLEIYPDFIPHPGPDLSLHVLGWATPPRDNLDVFKYMYPDVTIIEGASASPCHLRAYAQWGTVFAFATLILVSFGLRWVALVYRDSSNPFVHAFYVQTLITAYYLTQTSATEAVTSSYGLRWAIVGLFPLWLITRGANRYRKQSRALAASGKSTATIPQPRQRLAA